MKNWMCSELVPENIIACSKVSLRRNFKDSFFDNKLSIDKARENVDKVYNTLQEDLKECNDLEVIRLWEEENSTLNMYKDKNIISSKLIENKEKGGVILNEDESLSILMNEEDNLKIQYISSGFSLKKAYKFADTIDDIIEKHYSYAFHPKYGYLTTDLNNIGTGLEASVIVHLPAITINKKINHLINILEEQGISIKAVYKDKEKSYGNLYEISNKKTLGVSEEDILDVLEKVIFNVVLEERKQREVLQVQHKYEIEDKIFRSYGILKGARILNSTEVLDLLSNVMFGVEMSLIEMDKDLLYRLIIETRDSIIQKRFGGRLSKRKIEIERAMIVSNVI